MEVFNELCILIIEYHLIIFTDLETNIIIRNNIGYNLIGIALFNICKINLLRKGKQISLGLV